VSHSTSLFGTDSLRVEIVGEEFPLLTGTEEHVVSEPVEEI